MRISDWSSDGCSSDLLLVIGVGDGIEIGFVLRGKDGLRIAPKIAAGHGDDMHLVAGDELAEVQAQLVVPAGGNLVDLVHRVSPVVERFPEIGRASGRERLCQYVLVSVLRATLKKK